MLKQNEMIEIGAKFTSQLTVDESVTAVALGSGDLPVLATPALIALMENAAMLAVAPSLPDGCTTVGGQIACTHLKPSRMGESVTAVAQVTHVEGKRIDYSISAFAGGLLIGEGTHQRFIVEREKFMSRLSS